MNIPDFLKSQKKHAGGYLLLAVSLGLMGGLLLILQAWFLVKIINAVIFEEVSLPDVKPWLWAVLGVFLLRAIIAWASEQAAFHAAAGVKQALRMKLYRHLQALGPAYLTQERSGGLVNTLADGIEALESYYARYLPAMSLMVLVPLSILIFVFPTDWISGLVMVCTAPLIPFFMILIGKGAERLNQRQWRRLARMSAHFLDMIQGLTTLKLFNASRREAQAVARISDEYRRDTMAVLRVAFLSSLALEFFATVSIAVVAVLIGFRLLWGELDFFRGLFVLLLAPEFYLPLRMMGVHYHARMEAIGAAEHMVEILETPVPRQPAAEEHLSGLDSPHIRFEAVHYSYPGEREALNGVSFEIRPGERLALAGPSGAGKTTIINLLLGFVSPTQGRILINDTPLEKIDLTAWYKTLAWVPQNPRLFHGTLKENILLGKPDANKKAIIAAARLARADEFIEQQPNGYNTLIGERGMGLSGGQIQRIALARAFLKEAPVVLLDEATANLDLTSEALIKEALDALAQDRTLLMIAHRLSTIKRATRILVLEGGQIVEQGAHEELIAREGVYWRLVRVYTKESKV